MFMNCIDVFCSFVHEIQNGNGFFFNFSSEAEHVLALLLFFGQSESQCVLIKTRNAAVNEFSP